MMNSTPLRSSRLVFLALPLLLVWIATPLVARQDDSGADSLTGDFLLGWRSVDVGGSSGKYRQHVDLDDGARLFGLHLKYMPAGSFADQIELDIENLGGDPFESIDLRVRRHGVYSLDFARRKSTYVYEDLLIPRDEFDARLSNGGDFHSWDFDRVRDSVTFDWSINPRARLVFDLERSEKTGDSVTTLDIQRDEFELDQVIDESSDAIGVAFEYDWQKAHLVLRERIEDAENAREIFLPGRSLGENTTNAAALDLYFLEQPTDVSRQEHQVVFTAQPTDRLDLRASVLMSSIELESDVSERAEGTGFRGDPYVVDATGVVDIDRDVDLYDLDVGFAVTDRVALVGSVGHRSLDQDGIGVFDDDGASRWTIDTDTAELGVEVAVSRDLTVTVGARSETRDVEGRVSETGPSGLAGSGHGIETDHTGFFASLGWKPSRALRLSLEVEDSSYDDPFTLTSPSDRQRFLLKGQYRPNDGWFVQGTVLAHRVDNDAVDWQSDFDSVSLRGGFRRDRFDGSIGYSFIDVDRRVDQSVAFGNAPMLIPVLYESESDFLDARFRWRPVDGLEVGADLRDFENDGDFAIERRDLRLLIDYELPAGTLLHLGWRTIDYEETLRGLNDYDADILEFGVGFRL